MCFNGVHTAFVGSGRPLIKLTIVGLNRNYALAYPPGCTSPVILTSLPFKFIGGEYTRRRNQNGNHAPRRALVGRTNY